jgi:multicomponent K+:H+ antiporter subunit A
MHVPSAFLFDIGVFLLVVGATSLMLIAIAHQSLRARRFEREEREERARRAQAAVADDHVQPGAASP